MKLQVITKINISAAVYFYFFNENVCKCMTQELFYKTGAKIIAKNTLPTIII